MADTILDAVRAAANEQGGATEEGEVETGVKQVTQSKEAPKEKETSKEEKEDTEEIELDARTTKALQLLDLLEDPEKGLATIQKLAKNVGLLKDDLTPKEEKVAVNKFKQLAKEKLGDEYEFLSDKIGDLLEAVVGNTAEDSKLMREELETMKRERAQEIVSNTYNSFVKAEKVTESEAAQIEKLTEEFQPGKNVKIDDYLGKLLKMVRSENAERTSKAKSISKIQENLKTKSTTGVEGGETKAERQIRSPKDAVRYAMEDLGE